MKKNLEREIREMVDDYFNRKDEIKKLYNLSNAQLYSYINNYSLSKTNYNLDENLGDESSLPMFLRKQAK